VTQSNDQSIKYDDRYSEKVVTLKFSVPSEEEQVNVKWVEDLLWFMLCINVCLKYVYQLEGKNPPSKLSMLSRRRRNL
jgi:hypothetical protein